MSKMKKKSSIIKLCIIGVVMIIGTVFCFCSFQIGNKDLPSWASNIKLGLDLKGGIYAEYVAIDDDTDDIDTRMDGTVTSISTLLVSKGYSEATVVRQGTSGIRVEVPDVDNPEDILNILGEPASLMFRIDDGDNTGDIVLTGDNVVSASAGYYNSEYVVSLNLDSDGAVKFAEATAKCAEEGTNLSIYVAYGDEVTCISTASVSEQITGGQAIISGDFTLESAQQLSDQIMSGTFGVTLELQKCEPISATLGEGALKYGLIAGAIGLILVMCFMCWKYRAFGLSASLVLWIYSIMMIFLLSVVPLVQLTLPGIAGILLSIGMAIDGNVIIYERMKDEYANGKSIMAAAHYGYRKSVSAIRDGNITTIIASVILYIFGSGSVQGFAITLLIGLVLAMFSSLVVTRGILNYTIAINHTNPDLYNLKRGKNYISLAADTTDSVIQQQLDEEDRIKRETKMKKKAIKLAKKQQAAVVTEEAVVAEEGGENE